VAKSIDRPTLTTVKMSENRQHISELRSTRKGLEVLQADELTLVLEELPQAVVLGRQPQQHAQRIAKHAQITMKAGAISA